MKYSALNANKKIKDVLVKILDQHYLGTKNNDVIVLYLDTFLNNLNIDTSQLLQILSNLREKKIIKSIEYPFEKILTDKDALDVCYLTVPVNFRVRSESYIKKLSEDNSSKSGLILYLDKNGNFWHGDKSKNCYPMGTSGGRFAIIKYLVENEGPQATSKIAYFLGEKGVRSVMNEIGKIKHKIKHHLKLTDVIKNEKPLGYCIDPKYKIVITD